MPKWANSERQAYLVNLWQRYGNRCLHGHAVCPIASHYIQRNAVGANVVKATLVKCQDSYGKPILDKTGNQGYITSYTYKLITTYQNAIARLYDVRSENVVTGWIADDRAHDRVKWQAEQKALHSLGEVGRVKGEFNAISREVFFAKQAIYHFESIGISGLTFRPFAKVRLTSSFVALHVDMGDVMRTLSKNQKHKAIRYGKITPEVKKEIDRVCSKAVKNYLK